MQPIARAPLGFLTGHGGVMARSLLGKLKRGLFMTHTEFLEKAGEAFRRE